MKFLFSLCAAFVALTSFSQNVPDWELIQSEVTSPVSQFYYPALLARYEKNDTTLTHHDYYYLYYGYSTQENYKPLLKTNYVDSLNSVFSNRYVPTGDEFSRIERYCKAILSVEPFNLRDINVLAFAYQQIGYKDKAKEQMYKLQMLIDVIKSTGTGYSENRPWYVIYADHAEDVLNIMDAQPGRRIVINREVEFIACKNTPDKAIKGYYFDMSAVQLKDPSYMEGVDRNKWKLDINPVQKTKKEYAK